MNHIITISRQHGSGGREIGERLAELLGIPIYDKEIIQKAAANGDIDERAASRVDEVAANSLLYTLAMGSNSFGATAHFGYKMPLNDKLFVLQSDVIRELAKGDESCIIIGRCADYILRENDGLFRIFVYGDLEHRQKRVAERHPEIKSSQIIDVINKTDKRRSSYYNFYTGNKWGKYDNYDIAVNSSTLGIEGTAKLLADAISSLMENG